MPQIQVTLTPAESKRLIAKAVAKLEEVQRALREGIIVISVGSTTAYVAEELLGRRVERERFLAGVVLPKGTCVVPPKMRLREMVIRRGEVIDARADDVLPEMGPGDVFIKGANALDASGVAGVFLADPRGGTVGRSLGAVMSKGINLIIPVGLEKFIPGSLVRLAAIAGIERASFATGVPLGLMPLAGRVVTELEAIRILTGAEAMALGKGGLSGAEGSVTLLVLGSSEQLGNLRALVNSIKGESYPKVETDCDVCENPTCWLRGR
ncbi:MAG: hypothetical protein NZ934_04130 [Hadesarchaea archaeon]|nr:hypothetical protein [Hadesarchaea archaeon]